jgi:hypothetical protein
MELERKDNKIFGSATKIKVWLQTTIWLRRQSRGTTAEPVLGLGIFLGLENATFVNINVRSSLFVR